MPNQLEIEFHEAMLNIYRKAENETGYSAQSNFWYELQRTVG